MAAWLAMCLAGLLEYTWGTRGGLAARRPTTGASPRPFWAFSFFVIFESFVQIFTGILRNRGILNVRWATIIGGIVCGIVGYGLLATVHQHLAGLPRVRGPRRHRLRDGLLKLHQHRGQVVPGEEGLADRVRERRLGLRRGPVHHRRSARPAAAAAHHHDPEPDQALHPGSRAIIMTVGIGIAGFFMKDPPKNWWPKEIDPLNWQKHSTRDLRSQPARAAALQPRRDVADPAGQMDRHPVRPVHRLLPVRRGVLLPLRAGNKGSAAWRRWPASPASHSPTGCSRPVYG